MLGAWVAVGFWIVMVILTNRKQHPKALFFLFLVELWERFSYYGMRAFLVLYLTKTTLEGGFEFTKVVGNGIYAAYVALVYLTPLAGGYLADKYLGFRRSIIWGALLMAFGQFTLSASNSTEPNNEPLLYIGLSLLVIGNGFFKPNISSLIGRFYPQGDSRRDGAFTIFYMGINIGAFLAPLTCGTVAELEGWRYGFMLAGCGMLLGLGIFLYTCSTGILETKADPPLEAGAYRGIGGFGPVPLIYLGSFLAIPLLYLLIVKNEVMDYLLSAIGLTAVGYMIWISLQYPKAERERIWVIIVLFFFTTIFWALFELAGGALNLFTDKHVSKSVMGLFTLKTSNFQALNPLFIMLFAPLFSIMWIQLAKRNREPSAPIKFAFSLIFVGAGFLVMNLGNSFASEAMVPALFLILLYLLHTIGELAMSPVGLSLVTKLAPAKVVGFMMGFWFLSTSLGSQAGAWIGKFMAGENPNATPDESLQLALGVFNTIGLFAIGSGVFLLVLSPIIKRWMHGIK